MDDNKKRKAEGGTNGDSKKKLKWTVPRKGQKPANIVSATINPGDTGIWVTCDMHKEGKCTAEARDFFNEYAREIYEDHSDDSESAGHKEQEPAGKLDIEQEISQEVTGIKEARKGALFVPVKVDIQCVLFFKTREPVEPVSFVHKICSNAKISTSSKKSRWIKRITPMTRMGKANEKGLEEVSKAVLEPHFHAEGATAKKFAIRTTIRNNTLMKRDDVIKQVATAVGPRHSVDLKHYDALVLLVIYRNILGMSVVGSDFEQLKRFNLAEIHDPTPRPEMSQQ